MRKKVWQVRNLLPLLILTEALVCRHVSSAQEPTSAPYLSDRGTGVSTSMFGTYIDDGELLVYTFFEYYHDNDFEYKPAELGYGLDQDFRGKYRASEGLIFFGYGVTPDLALEFEAAVITAKLETSPNDPTAVPATVKESGLGDVESQLRWRFSRETESSPEAFTFFETVFPLQKDKRLIGTRDWEFNLGIGLIRGYEWGTMTFRVSAEYARADRQVDAGEFAFEYLRRLSPTWRIAGILEVNQLDEVELITEVQWRFLTRATLKLNNGWGLTTNATDLAPELGILMSF